MAADHDDIRRAIDASSPGFDGLRPVYADHISGPEAEATIEALFQHAVQTRDCRLMSCCDIFYALRRAKQTRRYLDFCKQFVAQFWCSNHADAVGAFQGHGRREDLNFLERIAMDSLASWDARNDDMQQFFRKCTWAIGEIDRRDATSTEGMEILMRMAQIDPPIAAYWAKKQINRTLGDRSPYAAEDLSEPPEIDHDWPPASAG